MRNVNISFRVFFFEFDISWFRGNNKKRKVKEGNLNQFVVKSIERFKFAFYNNLPLVFLK